MSGRRAYHRSDRHEEDPNGSGRFTSADPATTGREAEYLKSLVDSRAKVTVVLVSGESLSGRIRYYDRDCFSIGPSGGGAKIFLRKSSVRYIAE